MPIYQRSFDGRWVAYVSLGGKKIARYAKTEREARTRLRELERAWGLGTLRPPSQVALGEWVDQWLERKVLRASSTAAYTRALRAWTAELGTVRLQRLTPELLGASLARWWAAGVGARSLEQRYTYLKACLEEARRSGILAENPLERVPKPSYRPALSPQWSAAQAQIFLETCQASPRVHADLLAFLLLSGLRLGEALGLEWGDLEWTTGHIQVRRALVWVGGNLLSPEEPKTRAGVRRVALPPAAWTILHARPRTHARVFVTRTGTPPRKDNLSRLMADLCREARLPRLEVRGLRRVHAALLVRGGLDPKSLQAHLGHARASLSMEVYAYWTGDDRTREAWERGMA